MIHLFFASTVFQVAALDQALATLDIADNDLKVLIFASNSQVPELTDPVVGSPVFTQLTKKFDAVHDFAEFMWPLKAGQFRVSSQEAHLWNRMFRSLWGLGDQRVVLYLESIQVNPAQAFAHIFWNSPIVIHSDGLMSYSPTRDKLPLDIIQRIDRVVYLDMVPGVAPVLLREAEPEYVALSFDGFVSTLAPLLSLSQAMARSLDLPVGAHTGLVLAQYLSHLGLVNVSEELALHKLMVDRVVADGASVVLFKPHPAAPRGATSLLKQYVTGLGVDFRIVPSEIPAEAVAATVRPVSVASCFSTALFTIDSLIDTKVRAVGTDLLLEKLTPFQNSNRIPVTLCDYYFSQVQSTPNAREAQLIVDATAYAMQSEIVPELRPRAQQFITAHPVHGTGLTWRRYIKSRRAEALGLVAPRPKKIKDEALRRKQEAPQPIAPGRPSILSRILGGFSKKDPRQTA